MEASTVVAYCTASLTVKPWAEPAISVSRAETLLVLVVISVLIIVSRKKWKKLKI